MEIRLCPRCQQARGEAATCPECREHVILVDPEYFVGQEFGKYRIESVVGAGGMGVVYRAVHADLGKAVALKLLVPEGKHGDFVRRFRHEAKLLAGLRHPNIVEVFDLDVSAAGLPYYVMQLLEGQSLRSYLAGYPNGLPPAEFQAFVRQIGSALAYTHGRGIVHRDLKPENIFVEQVDGRPVLKVLDFGIAKMVAPDAQASTMTQTGLILGTPHYMAPEQITGVSMGPHTDQYAFALICWEMLTGRAARQGKTVGEIISQEIVRPLALDALPSGDLQARFGPPLARATAPDYRLRYPSVHAFVEAIAGDEAMETGKTRVSGTPDAALAPPASPASPHGGRCRRWLRWLALVLLPLLAAGAWLALRDGHKPEGPAPPEPESLMGSIWSTAVPSDADGILDYAGGILLKGSDAFYLLDPANPAMPARLALEPGETFLDGLPHGGLAILDKYTLFLADYTQKPRRVRLLLEYWKLGTPVAVSPTGRRFLLKTDRGFEVTERPAASRSRSVVHLEDQFSATARFQLGETVLVVADSGMLSVWDTRTAKALYETPIPVQGIGDLALLEEAGLAAVGGWFDEVFVADFKAGRTETVILPGQTFSLRFIADAPSLLIAKNDAVHLWRRGAGIVAAFKSDGARFSNARLTSAGLLALDAAGHRLHRLAYPGFLISKAIPTGVSELWALAAKEDGAMLYAGGSDGKLYAVDPATGAVTPHELHTQGITALLCREDILASASDDKTIALRKLPTMEVFWRSQAHDYLINALHFSPATRTLWSSSSDGKLKSWRWPQLAEVEEIVTGAGNHAALWVNDDETLILAGTWKRMLVVLEKAGGAWKAAQVFRLPCQSVYSMAFLPGSDTVIMTGAEPGAAFVYDLKARSLHRLPDLGLQACWATGVSQTAAIVAGAGGLLQYTVGREGATACAAVALAVNPRVGTIGVASLLKAGALAMGTAAGEVLLADLATIPFKNLATLPLDSPIQPALTDAVLPFALSEQ